ncbi:response regulator [Herbaspirillum huttiense]|jgi:CheY-like chemotaxis protein|uniref:Response regulator n=3 Tax=Herbaspirillum huttiense TaxID=863372 RepID=A0AAJ2HCY2_9BURK|nr:MULTISPECIES: response regulator [Herbaspirillum]MAF02734.1 response regulator [Herbaspirillum sp.]MBO17307.1 response regulator [Herbaspirillum sp.]MBP1313598.1 CheY-like chemotaxis protein [Herbaspirillum sp. 1130]MCO4856352.1 response regulator [Herbaspirillum sp. WGmk3]MCP3653711.1 response regulator [Herbaspirillum sp.]|tara:strand:- start:986 stop:1450 length:465 start_codon:yes stop_codon:yes gene_type:complete
MATEQSVNIILVEDDDGHAVLVEKNLRRAGLVNGFQRLRDGQEALDHFFGGELGRTDLQQVVVLLDVNMPRVNGVEVLRRMKQDAATAAIPVIMLTTTDDPREIAHCYEVGCNVYITKPVEYDDFIEAVRRLGFFLQVVKLPPPGAPVRESDSR